MWQDWAQYTYDILTILYAHILLTMAYWCYMDLDWHLLRLKFIACWCQAITWTNVDCSSLTSYGIHLKALSQEIIMIFVLDMILKILTWDDSHMSQGQGVKKDRVPYIFSCDQAALWMVFSVRLSVCLSVCPSVRLSHLFDYVPIIVSSWNF